MVRLPDRLLQGCAALLALVLSAFGGARLGVERAIAATDPNDDRPVIERATAQAAAVDQVCAAVVAAPADHGDAGADLPAAPRVLAPTTAREGSIPCALLLGCAFGPRAP